MSAVEPSKSLGALVAERPARAEVFERLRFDYCCGGRQTLAEACRQRDFDLETVRQLLAALDDAPLCPAAPLEDSDWRSVSLAELCDHISSVHHAELRRELPRIAELLARVVLVHEAGHPELSDLQRAFAGMRSELEGHLEAEERILFPACRALEADGSARAGPAAGLLARHEHEHEHTGRALGTVRELAGGYDPSGALCSTHRALLHALRRLERDLHQHIHEENNVLFVRARTLVAAAEEKPRSGPYGELNELPRCCQAWIGEARHEMARRNR